MAKRKSLPYELRRSIFEAAHGVCTYCGTETNFFGGGGQWGRSGRFMERYYKPGGAVDHIIPVAFGGTDDLDNLCWSCWHCNSSKQHRSMEAFQADLAVRMARFA